ncbi:FHA domain-containing protein [Myxococcus sp. RHSTA-1-4]|uniref:FHA domain-containing protein n=1 Tax=Myxococcus sp. RHSTA-1-4 TaxID=2874601 RepID=UPI001CBC4BB2|nr:FHA domain-containing protein [Myxococcus sp. RHSTA-1-4]MBZ4416981.1 FHA domain-containing protein [Myxococcus sp. RHSTA-1-4]
MAPPNPKRPPRPPRPPGTQAPKDSDVELELPFDDDEVAPLRADDPRPQRVPQYPAGSRRSRRQGTERGSHDRELAARFDLGREYSDPGYAPAFLYVERGPGTGQLVPVKQGPLVMGRSSSSDLRLQHPSISRRHAQLTRRGDNFFLKDLSSQNGTFLNRNRVTSEVVVMPGDEISMGNALLRLRGPGSTPAVGAPSVTATIATGRRWTGTDTLRVALIAAAVGSAVAALLTLIAVSLPEGDEAASTPPAPQPGPSAPLMRMAPEQDAPAAPGPAEASDGTPEAQTAAAPDAEPPAAGAETSASPVTAPTSPEQSQVAEPGPRTEATRQAEPGPSAADVARGKVAPSSRRR